MDTTHMWLILGLALFFVLAIWIKKGIVWGIPLALSVLLAYKAITQTWEVYAFPPIVGIFIISILGFIYTSIQGDFI